MEWMKFEVWVTHSFRFSCMCINMQVTVAVLRGSGVFLLPGVFLLQGSSVRHTQGRNWF